MSHTDIKNLLSQLHDTFGSNAPSPQIAELMAQMQRQLDSGNADVSDAASELLLEVEAEHPDATAIVLNIIEVLDRMGI